MKPAIVLPIHDPAGIDLPYLARVQPDLGQLFERAFIGLSAATVQQQSLTVEPLRADQRAT